MTKRVLISNREGVEYSVTVADYRRLYADDGFKIDSYEDGTPYEGDEKPTAAKRSKGSNDDEG